MFRSIVYIINISTSACLILNNYDQKLKVEQSFYSMSAKKTVPSTSAADKKKKNFFSSVIK